MKKAKQNNNFLHATRGFSLVELVVSIGIFTIITSLIMVSQNRFGGRILTTNLAYDVALGIRQAQVYGISVKKASQVCGSSRSQFDCAYGVHFDSGSKRFILFVDLGLNGDKKYQGASGDDGTRCLPNTECISFFKIQQGNSISGLCVGNACTTVDSLDIVFQRPDPEPQAITGFISGVSINSLNAEITVASPQGFTKKVNVLASGQISIR